MKAILFLTLALLLAGCASDRYHYYSREGSRSTSLRSTADVAAVTPAEGPIVSIEEFATLDKSITEMTSTWARQASERGSIDGTAFNFTKENVSGDEVAYRLEVLQKSEFDFAPGQYDVSRSPTVAKGLATLAPVISGIKNVLNKGGLSSNIIVEYLATSDRFPIRHRHMYAGEYGSAVSVSDWILNGQSQEAVVIEQGDSLNNTTLALLRAISGMQFCASKLSEAGISIDGLEKRLSVETGKDNRIFRVSILVKRTGKGV